MKSLTTRSGHTIKLNDSLSSLGITIKDIKGNSIHIDSVGDDIIINAKRNITINAGETFTVNAREMEVNIDGDIIEKIGKNKISTIGNKISLEAMEKEEEITENTNINIGGHLTQEVGDIVLETFSGDAIIIAEGKALLQGKDDARISKG
jgi:rhs element vgr protein family protein (fragment)